MKNVRPDSKDFFNPLFFIFPKRSNNVLPHQLFRVDNKIKQEPLLCPCVDKKNLYQDCRISKGAVFVLGIGRSAHMH